MEDSWIVLGAFDGPSGAHERFEVFATLDEAEQFAIKMREWAKDAKGARFEMYHGFHVRGGSLK